MNLPKRPPTGSSATPNPLTRYSLLGHAAELEKNAIEQKPLLGSVCLTAQATVWYGKYGTGKSLIFNHLLIEALQDRRIEGSQVVVINADDSSGGLAEKVRLFQDYGVHVLAPGFHGFRSAMLAERLAELVATSEASGIVVVLDTFKKFVDLMEKRAMREFNTVVREFVLQGGTLLALAHTNKHPGSDGKPVPEGTGDALNDFDCSFLLDTAGKAKATGETVIVFECVKSRGAVAQREAYAYDPDKELSYMERLASVRRLDPDDEDYAVEPPAEDEDVIHWIEGCIDHGVVKKMDIARTAAVPAQVSRRTVLRVLEKYTGDDPQLHRWNFTVRERGAMVYRLLVARDI